MGGCISRRRNCGHPQAWEQVDSAGQLPPKEPDCGERPGPRGRLEQVGPRRAGGCAGCQSRCGSYPDSVHSVDWVELEMGTALTIPKFVARSSPLLPGVAPCPHLDAVAVRVTGTWWLCPVPSECRPSTVCVIITKAEEAAAGGTWRQESETSR